VTILFKYEKLGVFCYLCGVVGHTDKSCPKLFDMEHDDGTRGWGENIRPLIKRMGTAATNKYLQDPIPSRPHAASGTSTGSQSAFSQGSDPTPAQPAASNFDGRIVAVQKEISAIKSGILIAHKQALVKSGRNFNDAGPSQARTVVLGLPATPHYQPQGENSLGLEGDETEDSGADLKKRKRAKAGTNTQESEAVTNGDEGILDHNLGIGLDNVMTVNDNPMFDASIVTAGPEVQACREL
jgi:hypothetical protein